ncbi:MAG: acetyl-CoA carboxylase biotin carboxyl carrier protein [Calditrichaeota bacterium]|nr:MAG: acetyl-CoA carboxylase biotin carboxyl carrier protein [Calditrichota bacterium]
MKEEEIRRLVKIVEESNISELEISRWGKTIRISKFRTNSNAHATEITTSQVASTPHPPVPPVQESKPQTEKQIESKPVSEAKNIVEIKSPMVGTFYRAPAPDADPYVEVNDVVTKGQVLCIIEAMKLMNEIESEYNGRIVEILVENGQPVEYNQPLFRIELTE